MAFRLTFQLGSRSVKEPLRPGQTLVGSDPACSIVLTHPTVSRRHARLTVSEHGVELEDLGSSNGTRVGNQRVGDRMPIEPGSELAFGNVTALLEEVREGDLKPAVSLGPLPNQRPMPPPEVAQTTLSSSAVEEFTLEQLPRLLWRLDEGADAVEMAQAVGATFFRCFPCLQVEVLRLDAQKPAVLFAASIPDAAVERGATVESDDDHLRLRVTFYPPSLAELYAPILETGRQLIRLGKRQRPRGTVVPRSDQRPRPTPPPLPAPPTMEPVVQKIYAQAARIAFSEVSVLIQGESGTGKEVLARYIHRASCRPEDRFVALNCAALPRDLLELELFGIEQGVATGVDARAGKFELASEGTLFLDEIGDMAIETQAKILRVLQEKEVYRLGSKQPKEARVRVLAATNRDIDNMVSEGSFRSDLFHRIAGWVVRLPPLRERRADTPNLAAHFLAREAEASGARLAGISQSAMEALISYEWPGNIRELQREISRAALFLSDGELLESTHLQPSILAHAGQAPSSLKDILERVEREQIEQTLRSHQGDTQAAALELGIGRSTLYRRMKALGVQENGV